MGCQAEKEHLPAFHLILTRTSLKSIDDFYEEVERAISRIQSLSESIEIVIDKFASATGLYGPPHRTVAFGLLGMLVCLLSSVKNDTMKLELHFSDHAPGLILQESTLEPGLLIPYHSWIELIEFLEAAVDHLQQSTPRMGEFLIEAKGVLDKVQTLPEASELRPIDYRKLEKTVSSNFEAIRQAAEQLQRLISKVKSTLLEAFITLEELGKLTDLSQLLSISKKARKRGITVVPDLLREFGFELDQIVKEQKRVLLGGFRLAI